jgi:hypothetical protein
MAKKELTEFTIRCQCGAAAPIFKLKNARFMAHCPDCGALVFFSNPVLLERARHGMDLCPHNPERVTCSGGWTTWCSKCRVRSFYYSTGTGDHNVADKAK